jgi:hypothetical protein
MVRWTELVKQTKAATVIEFWSWMTTICHKCVIFSCHFNISFDTTFMLLPEPNGVHHQHDLTDSSTDNIG